MECHFTIASHIGVAPEAFWPQQSMRTLNVELAPLWFMTAPRGWRERPIVDWPAHRRLFSSWILLLGVFPCDRHRFGRVTFPRLHQMEEESTSWLHRRWRHVRRVVAESGGSRVEDTVTFEPRLAFLAPAVRVLVLLAFRRRHAALRARYPVTAA